MGTLRTFDNNLRKVLIERINKIVSGTAEIFKGSASLEVLSDVPAEYNDIELSSDIRRYARELLGTDTIEDILMTGSEDFAYISEIIPSVLVFIAATDPEYKGKVYGGHHSRAVFDENALPISAALYAQIAEKWLFEHS